MRKRCLRARRELTAELTEYVAEQLKKSGPIAGPLLVQ